MASRNLQRQMYIEWLVVNPDRAIDIRKSQGYLKIDKTTSLTDHRPSLVSTLCLEKKKKNLMNGSRTAAPRLANVQDIAETFAKAKGSIVVFGATGRLGRCIVHTLLQVNEMVRDSPPLDLCIVSRDVKLAERIVDDQQPVRIRQRMLNAHKLVSL